MRTLRHAVLAATATACCASAAWGAGGDVERARALDQQGVRAYREERYNDAIEYFQEAFKLGGPSSELWNIAKCHLRLDDPEDAAKEIEEYLSQGGLSPSDRAEATNTLHELQHRHSTLTVASSPPGATVYLDGHHPAGTTPATVDIPPGSHTVELERPGYERYSKNVEAHYGRAVIVDAKLDSTGEPPVPPSPGGHGEKDHASTGAHGDHRILFEGELGVAFPRFGSVAGNVSPVGFLSASWVFVDAPKVLVTAGLRATLSGDGWSNTIGAPSRSATCTGTLPNTFSGTAFDAFVAGGAAWRPSPRLRLGGDFGLGIATLSVSQVGGDVFVPSCTPSPGVKPAIHLGLEGSYAVTRDLRLLFSPLVLEIAPAFNGTRDAPDDASGSWLRFGIAVGLAFDVL